MTEVIKKVILRKMSFGWALNSWRRRFTIEDELGCKSKMMDDKHVQRMANESAIQKVQLV